MLKSGEKEITNTSKVSMEYIYIYICKNANMTQGENILAEFARRLPIYHIILWKSKQKRTKKIGKPENTIAYKIKDNFFSEYPFISDEIKY